MSDIESLKASMCLAPIGLVPVSARWNVMNKFSVFSVLLISMLLALPATRAVAANDDVMKVVYHADYASPRRLSAMLTSINNMVTTYLNDLVEYDVRIVFVSYGIRFLTKDKLAKTPFAEDKELAEKKATLCSGWRVCIMCMA